MISEKKIHFQPHNYSLNLSILYEETNVGSVLAHLPFSRRWKG